MRPAHQPRLAPAPLPGRLDRFELAAIFSGGFLGALARSALSQALGARAGQWPWATFLVNLLAALALGYLLGRQQAHLRSGADRRSLIAISACGALSTFSTMMLEILRMLDLGDLALAGAYAAASLGCGFVVAWIGTKLARKARLGR